MGIFKLLAAAVGIAACAGCAAVDVAQDNSSGACEGATSCSHEVPGIPFNVKVPQPVQTTKWVAQTLVVSVKTRMKVEGKYVEKHISLSPIELYATTQANEGIAALERLVKARRPKIELIAARLAELRALANAQKVGAVEGAYLVSNSVSIETSLSDRQYYFTPRMPVVGSTDSSIELQTDGTMSKAAVEVEDKTLETVLSLFPFKEVFSKVLGLGKGGAGLLAEGMTTPPSALVFSVSEGSMLYTLKRIARQDCGDYSNGANGKALKPLALSHRETGTCGVQLVSVASSSAGGGGGEGGEEEKPGYSITGKITLPETKGDK